MISNKAIYYSYTVRRMYYVRDVIYIASQTVDLEKAYKPNFRKKG